jgi:transketolase
MDDPGMMTQRGRQVRHDAVLLASQHNGSHLHGSLSCADILIALYDRVLKKDDVFVMSKGHAPWVQLVLLRERGLKPECTIHPKRDPANGIHVASGSLGHGFPQAVGMAWGRKITKKRGRVYCMVGDGECQEGTTWECLLTAPFRQLDNLCVIVDANMAAGSDWTDRILHSHVLERIAGFMGWEVRFCDGHDAKAVSAAMSVKTDRPVLVWAETTKGSGVSFMSGKPEWHSRKLTPEQTKLALEELA